LKIGDFDFYRVYLNMFTKPWNNIFRVVILTIGLIVIAFNALLYNFYEQQKKAMNILSEQQKVESQISSNEFKYQQEKMENLSKDLDDARQQIKYQKAALADEKDAFLQEVEKRQQIENENKNVQTSLVDIKAEADAIKENLKGWQKDYVSVLADLEKKMDDSHDQIKSLKDNIDSLKDDIEKMTPASDNSLSNTPPVQQ
jgi:chromosome segregation ATPase